MHGSSGVTIYQCLICWFVVNELVVIIGLVRRRAQ